MNIKNTSNIETQGINALVYGQSGCGKTYQIQSLEDCLILSAEDGLLSLKGTNIEYIDISSLQDLREAYSFIQKSKDATRYQTIAIDSISEVAERILQDEKKRLKDARAAYLVMQDSVIDVIRSFRSIKKNIYVTAKIEKIQDDVGRVMFAPSSPGTKLSNLLPYHFDEVFALKSEVIEKTTERFFICGNDQNYVAKDRSGILNHIENLSINEIFKKIRGVL